MIPPCYNRPPRVAGTWERTGRASIRLATPGVQAGVKEHLRWRPSPFEDRCATHDGRGIGPNGESYPDAHGWDCRGCRWNPGQQPAVDNAGHNPEVIPSYGWLVEECVIDALELEPLGGKSITQAYAERIAARGLIPVLVMGEHRLEMHGYEPMGDWGAHEIADRIRAEDE